MTVTHHTIGCLAATALLAACSPTPVPPPPGSEEAPTLAVTGWTDRTELFMEYAPLVAGETVRFAIHLTDLRDFSPVREGTVVVRFEGTTVERFEVNGPSRPGIFGVDVTAPAAGRYQMAIELHGASVGDEHRVGTVTVFSDSEQALASVPTEEEGATSFLKEQQWTLDFATMTVDDEVRRAVLTVPATVEPRAGGRVDVRALVTGRIAAGGGRALGTHVAAGDPLAEIIVQNTRVGEAPVLRLELSNAQAELRLVRQNLVRVEKLVTAGALPMRRLDEARVEEETAAARVQIAEEELRHLELGRSGSGAGDPNERVVVRAPISGVIFESLAAPGAAVETGELLYRIVSLDRVHVIGAAAEQNFARIQAAVEAEIVVPGLDPIRARRVSIGRVVDRETRTVPVVFEIDRPPATVAIGQAVSLRLIIDEETVGVSVPNEAIVDDAGQPIVFVQAGGESFERRPVRLGSAREGGHVQVISGLEAGERIVTRGAHLVRLAALSPQTPGHGHVH